MIRFDSYANSFMYVRQTGFQGTNQIVINVLMPVLAKGLKCAARSLGSYTSARDYLQDYIQHNAYSLNVDHSLVPVIGIYYVRVDSHLPVAALGLNIDGTMRVAIPYYQQADFIIPNHLTKYFWSREILFINSTDILEP